VGALPLAVTNCLNFANPQRPEIMAQIVHALEGMSEACRALDFPIVSGNVSLYNESKATGGGSAILPTPAIGGVGLMEDWTKAVGIGFKTEGEDIYLIGHSVGHLGQSLWLREIVGREAGPPPPVDLNDERKAAEFVKKLLAEFGATAVHDCSDGGVLVAIAEMALASGVGAKLIGQGPLNRRRVGQLSQPAWAFGEDQGRYVVTVPKDALEGILVAPIAIDKIGETAGTGLALPDGSTVSLADLRAAHEGFFPKLMGGSKAA